MVQMEGKVQLTLDAALYNRFRLLGLLDATDVRKSNVGESDYSRHLIQPWAIWKDYGLNPWDADIVKRILRSKGKDEAAQAANRVLDYKKIIHICQERIRQLELE